MVRRAGHHGGKPHFQVKGLSWLDASLQERRPFLDKEYHCVVLNAIRFFFGLHISQICLCDRNRSGLVKPLSTTG
jgi:hypothetical protein